jgi:transcriptional regulator with XRE-family HTH domain
MEMLISREWLRRKIEADPDVENDVGLSVGTMADLGMFLPPELQPDSDNNVVRLKEAFGALVRQLRLRDGLSISELAAKARIDQAELRQIEDDAHFRPRPRTVHQISLVFKLPERATMKLSGATVSRDPTFEEEAIRFAAKSADLSSLNSVELHTLKEFVKYLSRSEKARPS